MPKTSWDYLLPQLVKFSKKIESALNLLSIEKTCKQMRVNHICVQLKSKDDLDTLKQQLMESGQNISTVNINGCEICLVQLDKFLYLGVWKVNCIKLIYPSLDNNYLDGWEYVEFVLDDAVNTMAGVKHAFYSRFKHLQIKNLQEKYLYYEDDFGDCINHKPKPTVSIKVNGIGLKFHANSIQKVIGFK